MEIVDLTLDEAEEVVSLGASFHEIIKRQKVEGDKYNKIVVKYQLLMKEISPLESYGFLIKTLADTPRNNSSEFAILSDIIDRAECIYFHFGYVFGK